MIEELQRSSPLPTIHRQVGERVPLSVRYFGKSLDGLHKYGHGRAPVAQMAGRDLAPPAVIAMACGDDNRLAGHCPIEVLADKIGKTVPGQLHHLEQRDPARLDHQPVDFPHMLGGHRGNELGVGSHWTNSRSDHGLGIAREESPHPGGPAVAHDCDGTRNRGVNSAGPHRCELPLNSPCVTRRSPSRSQITMDRCSVTMRRAPRNRPSVLVTVSRVAPIMLAMSWWVRRRVSRSLPPTLSPYASASRSSSPASRPGTSRNTKSAISSSATRSRAASNLITYSITSGWRRRRATKSRRDNSQINVSSNASTWTGSVSLPSASSPTRSPGSKRARICSRPSGE